MSGQQKQTMMFPGNIRKILQRSPLIILIVLFLVTVCGIEGCLILNEAVTLQHVKQTPLKPFPSIYITEEASDGTKRTQSVNVRWIPDTGLRKDFIHVQPGNVEYIELEGGGETGVPASQKIRITDPILIALYLTGVQNAVLPEPIACFDSNSGGIVVQWDMLTIKTKAKTLHFPFYADWLRQSHFGMNCLGTISPEFVYALRRTGIPETPRGAIYRSLLLRQSGVEGILSGQ